MSKEVIIQEPAEPCQKEQASCDVKHYIMPLILNKAVIIAREAIEYHKKVGPVEKSKVIDMYARIFAGLETYARHKNSMANGEKKAMLRIEELGLSSSYIAEYGCEELRIKARPGYNGMLRERDRFYIVVGIEAPNGRKITLEVRMPEERDLLKKLWCRFYKRYKEWRSLLEDALATVA